MSQEVLNKLRGHEIEYMVLQFADLFGVCKELLVHKDEWDTVMEGRVMIDGSSVKGFGGVEDSDLKLIPDAETLHIQEWRSEHTGNAVAAMFCDIGHLDGRAADGCTRSMLKRVLDEASLMGCSLQVGLEGEFFLFPLDDDGMPELGRRDRGTYCDVFPRDQGDRTRMDILAAMKKHGFHIEAAHHEVAPGQHEINFRFGSAMQVADQWQKFKQIVKYTAHRNGVFASFMPKPMMGRNGNAMHCNQSLQNRDGDNVFYDESSRTGLSRTADHYMAGLLHHAKGMAAIANPTVNSYKRLMPGYEAPAHIAWSRSNRTASIRIPGARGRQTRIELRTPDPTANPYLLFAVMLKAGLEGMKEEWPLPEEAQGNIYEMTSEERARSKIESYPRDLHDALEEMGRDDMIRGVMGSEAFEYYMRLKREEARLFAEEVHPWEVGQYLLYC